MISLIFMLDVPGSIPDRCRALRVTPQAGGAVSIMTRLSAACPRLNQEMFVFSKVLFGLWGPQRLLFSGYCGLFSREKSGLGVKLMTHPYLLPKFIMSGAVPSFLHIPLLFAQRPVFILPFSFIRRTIFQ